MKKGFTLIEIVIVLSIIIILIGLLTYLIKPIEIFKKNRDFQRLNDLKNLELAINTYLLANPNADLDGIYGFTGFDESNPSIFISLPYDTQALSFATITDGNNKLWSIIQNASSTSLALINGEGWLPINFTEIRTPPILSLPIDPVNSYEKKLFYSYAFVRKTKEFELNANLEYDAYKYQGLQDKTSIDGGSDNEIYEAGMNKCIIVGNRLYGEITTTTCKQPILSSAQTSNWLQIFGKDIMPMDIAVSNEATNTFYYIVSGYKKINNTTSLPWFAKIATSGRIISSYALNIPNTTTSVFYTILTVDENNDSFIDKYVFGGFKDDVALIGRVGTSSNVVLISTSTLANNSLIINLEKADNGNYIGIGWNSSSSYIYIISSTTGSINSLQNSTATILSSIVKTNNGYFLIAGKTNFSYYLAKIDQDGNILMEDTSQLNGENFNVSNILDINKDPLSNLYVALVEFENSKDFGFVSFLEDFSYVLREKLNLENYELNLTSFVIDSEGFKNIVGQDKLNRAIYIKFEKDTAQKLIPLLNIKGIAKKIIQDEGGNFLVIGYDDGRYGGFLVKLNKNGEVIAFNKKSKFNIANIFDAFKNIYKNLQIILQHL